MKRLIVTGAMIALLSHAEADFTYHWEMDETPAGSDSVTLVEPVQVMLLDEPLKVASHSAALRLMNRYSVHLHDATSDSIDLIDSTRVSENAWTSKDAHALLSTFESIPQAANGPYDEEPRVPPSIWRLTQEHVPDDIAVSVEGNQRVVTIARRAFVHSDPLLAEIEEVRGRFFSKGVAAFLRSHRVGLRGGFF